MKSLRQKEPGPSRPLLDRPQPLGFLPTRHYWWGKTQARRVVLLPVVALGGALGCLFQFVGLPTWTIGLAGPIAVVGGLGLTEKLLRRALVARRKQRELPD